MTSLARCLAPLIWGALMSFSDSLALGQWIVLGIMSLGPLAEFFYIDEYHEDIKNELHIDISNDLSV